MSLSNRRKFAKLKVKFELEMRESEALVREQLRIEDVSRKLQETNEYGSPPALLAVRVTTNFRFSKVNSSKS